MSILVKTDDPSQLEAMAKYLPLKPYDPSSLQQGELKEKIQHFCNMAKTHFENMQTIRDDKIDHLAILLSRVSSQREFIRTVDGLVFFDEFMTNLFVNPAKRVYAHCIMVVHGYGHLSSFAKIDWAKEWQKENKITVL